jgi:hypothetical protein
MTSEGTWSASTSKSGSRMTIRVSTPDEASACAELEDAFRLALGEDDESAREMAARWWRKFKWPNSGTFELALRLEGSRVIVQLVEEPTRSDPRWTGHFLVAIAVRLMPQSERDRYLEEFRAELLDIPRETRRSHALSLLRGAVVLRLRGDAKNKTAHAAAKRAKD